MKLADIKSRGVQGKSMSRENMKGRKHRRGNRFWTAKDAGIDGILVTVGLCIIALLLCVVMKDSLTDFIRTIVEAMSSRAQNILGGTGAVPGM